MPAAQPNTVVTLLDELVRTLHEESDAIVAGDLERVTHTAQRKNRLLGQLAPEIARTPEAQRRQQDKVLRNAQRLNDRNARLLAIRMSTNRARTEALLTAAGGAMYAANGEVAGHRLAASTHISA